MLVKEQSFPDKNQAILADESLTESMLKITKENLKYTYSG